MGWGGGGKGWEEVVHHHPARLINYLPSTISLDFPTADLLAALTWPIDVSAELKELEDEPEVVTDYASLLKSQVEYKVSWRGGVG